MDLSTNKHYKNMFYCFLEPSSYCTNKNMQLCYFPKCLTSIGEPSFSSYLQLALVDMISVKFSWNDKNFHKYIQYKSLVKETPGSLF